MNIYKWYTADNGVVLVVAEDRMGVWHAREMRNFEDLKEVALPPSPRHVVIDDALLTRELSQRYGSLDELASLDAYPLVMVRSSGSGQCNAEYDQVWCPHEYAAPQHAHKLVPAGAVPAGAHLHGSTASLFRLLYGVLSVDDSGTFLGTWQHAAHVHAQRIIATQYAPDSKHLTDEDALRTYITKAGITDLHERIRLAYVFLGSVYRVIAFLYPHTASPLDQAHFVESLCMVIGDEIEPQAFIDQLSHAEEMLNIHNLKLAYARHVLFT